MKQFFKSPLFWVFFILLFVSCVCVVIKLTPYAFPIVHLNLTLDRDGALREARSLASKLQLGPKLFEQAASFDTDTYLRTFVELEGGGKEALSKIIDEGLYQPYTWNVRHYEPLDVHELTMRFTPQGSPYGFIESISQDDEGPELRVEQALSIVDSSAKIWGIKLENYELVESSKQENLSHRLDHTFVYERKAERLGEGRFRVRMVVSGDRLTELTHFVKVPDEFARRYEAMRALNDRLAWMAEIAVFVLYIVILAMVGLYLLIKQRWILWRFPILCATILATLNLLSSINNFPQMWMQYNTALDPHAFLANVLILSVLQCGLVWAFFSFVFIAAEGLTRKAFPEHLQLRSIWTSRNASSLAVWGRTLSGYLIVSVCLAFQAIFYVITARYLHWWIPSETLIEPNILASYAPWLEPVSQALTAGSVEECLFRAIPLASAALLGNRFGHRKSFITVAFILQALIFGAAHANYPMQPAYARIVELFVPSLIFGGLYLGFGLLPAILNHVLFDLVLMSVPIFVSSGTTMYVNEAMIVLISLIPIVVIVFSRIKQRSFSSLTRDAYNGSFVPPTKIIEIKPESLDSASHSLPARSQIVSCLLGLIGIGAYIFLGSFRADAPPMTLDRLAAVSAAQTFLSGRGLLLMEPWKTLSAVEGYDDNAMAQDFIWREGGAKLYEHLLGSYITPPHWYVRFAKFVGPVEERAEEYQLLVNTKAQVFRYAHLLPEGLPGASLNEDEARIIARRALAQELSLDPNKLREVSAVSNRLPSRTDWTFIFSDPVYPLQRGRAETSISIAGTQVVSWSQGILIPEEWMRHEQSSRQRASLIMLISIIPMFIVLLIGLVLGFMRLISERRLRELWVLCWVLLAAIFVGDIFNTAPALMAGFTTTKSFSEQLFIGFASGAVIGLVKAGIGALIISFILCIRVNNGVTKNTIHALSAASLGVFVAGMDMCLSALVPSLSPRLPDMSALDSYIPLLSSLSSFGLWFFEFLAFLLLVLIFLNLKTRDAPQYRLIAPIILFLCGFIISAPSFATKLPLLFALGMARGLLLVGAWYLVFRHDHALAPLALASYFVLTIMQQGMFGASWYSMVNAAIVSMVIACLGFIFFCAMNRLREFK